MKILSQLQLINKCKMVALTSSLFVMLVAFYNLSMDKLSKDQLQLNKANRIYDIDKMKISDMGKITPEVIEEYVEYLRSATANGKPKVSSDQTLKRKLCALSSFFDYYFQEGFIAFNPLLKVNRPIVSPHPPAGSNMQDNIKLLEYVSNGIELFNRLYLASPHNPL